MNDSFPWSSSRPLRIGTRGSALARRQTAMVIQRLTALHPPLADATETVIIRTSGDKIQDRPLVDIGGKGLFTREIEQALDRGAIDLAVHSAKDVPMQMQPGHVLSAFPQREDARDLWLSRTGVDWRDLPPGSVVGTASPRRQAQILMLRPDLVVQPMRGNVDTRLRKLSDGEADATILAVAGLQRLDLAVTDRMIMDPTIMVPAAGQGALAIEQLASRTELTALLAGLNDPKTELCVTAERAVVTALEGSCRTPIAALAQIEDAMLRLDSLIATPDGRLVWRDRRAGPATMGGALQLGQEAADALLQAAGPAAKEWRAA